MPLKCVLETRKTKEGKEYKVAVIYITDNTEKVVFLDKAEIELIEILAKMKNSVVK